MPASRPVKFYQNDLVGKDSLGSYLGIVQHCWHDQDVDGGQPIPLETTNSLGETIKITPLKRGEISVSFPSAIDIGAPEVATEDGLTLVDRFFQSGDIVKLAFADNPMSGVVIDVDVNGRLEHCISREQAGWHMRKDLALPRVQVGDYVLHDDWVGQVVETFDEVLVDTSDGVLICIPELSTRLGPGDKGEDILPPSPAENMMVSPLLNFLTRQRRGHKDDTVISISHTVFAISWLAMNQMLDPEAAQQRKRPQRFWHGDDVSKLMNIASKADIELRYLDRGTLKEENGPSPQTTHGKNGAIVIKTLKVTETQTTVSVLWQDNTRTVHKATELAPYLNPDEYDCWPGDHVLWKGEGRQRHAVVRKVDATQRVAEIIYLDNHEAATASLLDLDPHGPQDLDPDATATIGLRRGDLVFLNPTKNGYDAPYVPVIGEFESWVREMPYADGQLSGWRREMFELGMETLQGRDVNLHEPRWINPSPGDSSVRWIGEVTDVSLSPLHTVIQSSHGDCLQLNTDGSIVVTFPDGVLENYPITRLTRLQDMFFTQIEEEIWDEFEHQQAGDWSMDEDDTGSWESFEDDQAMNVDANGGWIGEDEEVVSETESMSFEPPKVDAVQEAAPLADHALPIDIQLAQLESVQPTHCIASEGNANNDDKDSHWKRFDILPVTPPDHAFLSSTSGTHSKTFLARLMKEYRALTNSLPDSIIMRTWEDRVDLLRCLIIGPENTPYADAPMVIDWFLDADFPHSPPKAFFHSWTQGNGRVNPNLYEDGKVCLSILNTWQGDRTESWNPARSTLLQALVSIQGLVLVREPWFCEPAHDKLRDTPDSVVNSRLYNERAYVLSRGFVRRALERPPQGLQDEIEWLYRTNGRLAKVVKDAQALIDTAQGSSMASIPNDSVVLTAGGVISLQRTLTKLSELLVSSKTGGTSAHEQVPV
ncbi:hypothetical protein FISHEDRAFT_66815 [Fistulina hepatica ATCC 64428]|uniref:UBC core domain-containing protein n=1 Tax=Fistulina hepatica ATCC 64428 TaxID=1128425 RepID=A0A0D7A768_9AGAR|nr:hypothetical protein FISHEDRAFT_66815 [Fistulina hepatica ATCC 64428]